MISCYGFSWFFIVCFLFQALIEREEKIGTFVKQRGFYQEEKDMLVKEQKVKYFLGKIFLK